jgi:hypothetical protein
MRILASIIIAALLTGCATNTDFIEQVKAHERIRVTEASADAEKYKALGAIANGAGDSTKQVALQAWQAVAMVDSMSGGHRQREAMPQAPESGIDKTIRVALGVASIAAPIAGNVILGLDAGKTNRRASDNATVAQLADARARVDSLAVVGSSNATIASRGFDALLGASQRPSSVITVTGNHNAVAALSSTATTTKNCTTGSTAPGGNSGNGGASGTGGSGATGTSTGTTAGNATGGNGAPSGATAPTGSGGQSGPTGSNGC